MLLLSSGATLVNSGAEISLKYHPSKDEAAHQTNGHSSHTTPILTTVLFVFLLFFKRTHHIAPGFCKKCKGEHLISGHFSQTSCLATPGITRNLSQTAWVIIPSQNAINTTKKNSIVSAYYTIFRIRFHKKAVRVHQGNFPFDATLVI